jgi:glucose 1-dehydrogenase
MSYRLQNQTAIVTGSSSGIGQAIAVALAGEGANVVINYNRDREGAKSTADMIAALDTDVQTIIVQCDVAKEKSVEKMFERAIKKFGTIDILVANSGIQQDAPFHEMTLKQWQTVIDVNLTGQFLCARAAIREFLRRGMRKGVSKALGKIIHMSSVHDAIPWAGHVNYAASKGGVGMLMQSLAQEYGKDKIRVNSVAPGAIRTPINEEAWKTKAALKKLMKLIPYNRIGEPEDIGKAVVWLCSDESDYITGTSLYVDGAMTNYPGFIGNG